MRKEYEIGSLYDRATRGKEGARILYVSASDENRLEHSDSTKALGAESVKSLFQELDN